MSLSGLPVKSENIFFSYVMYLINDSGHTVPLST